jgi:hypothetical protein
LLREFDPWAKARLIFGRLRGAEAPLFHVIATLLQLYCNVIATIPITSFPHSLRQTRDRAQNLHKHCFMSTFPAL